MPRKEKSLLKEDERRRVVYDAANPASIWADVLARDKSSIEAICESMKDEVFKGAKGIVATLFAWLAYPKYQRKGHYIDDSDLFADESGVLSRPQMAVVQRQYTLAHALCSTAAFWDPGAGEMVCMRSLDWPSADALAAATRIYEFHAADGANRSDVVGITGMCGVLTGVKHGGFSIALNYVSKRRSAQMKPDPTFLIRGLLENSSVETYADAVAAVEGWEVGAPCFITLCGVAQGEACVVEFGERERPDRKHAHSTRRVGAGGWIVQTNHYDSDNSKKEKTPADPYCVDASKTTVRRRAQLEQGLPGAIGNGGATMEEAMLDLWMTEPVLNNESVHIALMRPKSATLQVWRLKSVGPECPA